MNHLKILKEHLDDFRAHPLPDDGFPFVTISRQAGAGAHLLAYVTMTDFLKERPAELFEGWHVFDKELCEVVSQDPAMKSTMEAIRADRFRPEFNRIIESLFPNLDSQYVAYKRTLQIARLLATIGKVIIVGRAACLVTRDLPRGIHIRLVAAEATRVNRMMQRYNLSRKDAQRQVRKLDTERRRRAKTFFHRDIDDPLLYDAVWNTDTIDPHTIAHSLIDLIRRRAGKEPSAKSAPPPQHEMAKFFDFRKDLE